MSEALQSLLTGGIPETQATTCTLEDADDAGSQEIFIDGMPLQIPAGKYKTQVFEDGTVQIIVYQDEEDEGRGQGEAEEEEAMQQEENPLSVAVSQEVIAGSHSETESRNRRIHDIGIQNTTVPHFNSYSFSEKSVQTDLGDMDSLAFGLPAFLSKSNTEQTQVEDEEEEMRELEEESLGSGDTGMNPKGKKRRRIVKNPKVIQNVIEAQEDKELQGIRGGKDVTFHKCTICWKVYRNKANWMAHLKTHAKENVYMCGFCGQICQKMAFPTHVRAHQAEEDVKKIVNAGDAKATPPKDVGERETEEERSGQKPNETAMAANSIQVSGSLSDVQEKQIMIRTQEVMLPNQEMATVIDLGSLIDVAMNAEVDSSSVAKSAPVSGFNTPSQSASASSSSVTTTPQTPLATFPPSDSMVVSTESQCTDSELESPHADEPVIDASGSQVNQEEVKTKYIYKCNVCGKEYLNKSNCHRHLKSHTHEKLYKCSHCDKTYMHRYELRMHNRVHTGEKPFKCQICSRAFNEGGNLRRHMKIHAGDDTPYKCGVCFKGFTDLFRLHVHLKVHSGKIVCDTCGKKFGKISDLYRHIRIHTGDKPFRCDICQKAFCQKVNLQTHYRTHTGKQPYRCDICKFTFSRRQILENHMRGHEEEEEGSTAIISQDGETIIVRKEVADDLASKEEDQSIVGNLQMVEVDLSDVDRQTGLIEVPIDSSENVTGLTQEEIAQLVAATVMGKGGIVTDAENEDSNDVGTTAQLITIDPSS